MVILIREGLMHLTTEIVENLKQQIAKSKQETWEDLLEENEYGLKNLFKDEPQDGSKYSFHNDDVFVIIPENTFGSECDVTLVAYYGMNEFKEINDISGFVKVRLFDITQIPVYFVLEDGQQNFHLFTFKV